MNKLVAYVFWMLSRVNEPWYSWLNAAVNAMRLLRTPERPESFGAEHPDKTFYVIHDFPSHIGLAGWYDRVLGYMKRAEQKGWTPVIDGAEWTDYFALPSKWTFADCQQAARVIRAHDLAVVYKRISKKNIALRHRLSQLVPMNAACQSFCEEQFAKAASKVQGPLVGVYFRGTDYRKTAEWNAVGHSTVPTFDVFFSSLDRQISAWSLGAPTYFLVTEEEAILQSFKARYPKTVFIEKPRFVNFNFGVSLPQQTPGALSRLENNKLYLADLYALSKCDYLVGTMNGGIQMALNWNGNTYKGVSIFDFGTNRP